MATVGAKRTGGALLSRAAGFGAGWASIMARTAESDVGAGSGFGALLGRTPAFTNGELGGPGVRNAGLLALKNRMKSVKNVSKITSAMKMVAASRLKAAQVKMTESRGFWQPFEVLLGDASLSPEGLSKITTIAITSDKGLCGGVNSTITKYTRAMMDMNSGYENSIVCIGDKGRSQLVRIHGDKISIAHTDTQKVTICFSQVSMLVEEIMKVAPYDVAYIIFNYFGSVVSFKPTVATVYSPKALEASLGEALDLYEFEDGKSESLEDLAELAFAGILYNGLCENAASEMGARMSAMDNSTRNAKEMLGKLSLQFNRSRQAAITTELIEIISGAAALEGQ